MDLDDLMGYLITTGQVDETFKIKEESDDEDDDE